MINATAGTINAAGPQTGRAGPGTEAKTYRLDYWPEWGEWYADVASSGYRRLLVGRVAPTLLRKGFDGLFLDNTDMVESHPRQKEGMSELVRSLAALVHGRHRFLFTQNGEDSIGTTLRYYDGWNREGVSWTYDFRTRRYVRQSSTEVRVAQSALRSFAARGLLVLAIDYVAAGDTSTAHEAIANACSAGALPFLSNTDLTRIPTHGARC